MANECEKISKFSTEIDESYFKAVVKDVVVQMVKHLCLAYSNAVIRTPIILITKASKVPSFLQIEILSLI
ncbi:hypothetical protein F7P66_05880 [Campylobacter hyointestinalis subsp. lawsonii]|uniref:Uncharacterized protein n=1 Tax=Campylobacter hyointestinalis subsp. lawsonii TaxID=91353 RepID=A0AAV6EEQ9_CAMHY|nr:hypothetical protein F7P66_05880 [Campylobacter hyointestinalis subsp. lawsonii]RAZ27910.1 hypothetical protein CHLT_06240 [Campylobacter hyointestinalis subsp. lawsonii]